MSHFVGLDVSQKMTAICIVDKNGQRIWRGQCPSDPEQIGVAVRPAIAATFSLAEAADAHRAVDRNEHIGKIVLKVEA